MLMITALTLKKSVTLFALIGPVAMVPLFLAATRGLDLPRKLRFARTIGVSVTVALLVATFLGRAVAKRRSVNPPWISSSAWAVSYWRQWRWK